MKQPSVPKASVEINSKFRFILGLLIAVLVVGAAFMDKRGPIVEGFPHPLTLTGQLLTKSDTSTSITALSILGQTGNVKALERRANYLHSALEKGRIGEVLRILYDAPLAEKIRSDHPNVSNFIETSIAGQRHVVQRIIMDDIGLKDKPNTWRAYQRYYTINPGENIGKRIVFFDDQFAEQIITGDTISILQGYELGDFLIVERAELINDRTAIRESGAEASIAPPPKIGLPIERKAAIILVDFTNNVGIGTPESFANLFNGPQTNDRTISRFHAQNSFGQVITTAEAFGWYEIPYDNSNCSGMFQTWTTAANTISGLDLSQYNHVLYVFQNPLNCPASAWAEFGGSATTPYKSWYRVYSLENVGHELGHNMGLNHARTLECWDANNNPVPINTSDKCQIDNEYGDFQDIMSALNTKHFSSHNKARTTGLLNWLPSQNSLTVTQSGTYEIVPNEPISQGVKSLRIPRVVRTMFGGSEFLHIEMRSNVEPFNTWTADSPVLNGLLIRLVPDVSISPASSAYTYYLDAGSPGITFYDAPLLQGQTLFDPVNLITITVDEYVPNERARISIQFGTVPCVRQDPSITIDPIAQWAFPGESRTYSVAVTNNDNSECGSSAFSVTSVLPAGLTQNPATFNINLNPGDQQVTNITISSAANIPPGLYTFTETATNVAQPSYEKNATANFNVQAPDTILPQVTITTPADGATITGGGQFDINAASSDNIGVNSVQIFLNGTLKKTCNYANLPSPPDCLHSQNKNQLVSGANTITATATDSSGNQQSVSIIVYR